MRVQRFFTQEAVHEPLISSDGYYGDQFGPAVDRAVRWRYKHELVRNSVGQEVVASAHISTLAPGNVGDRVTDPYGVERRVISVIRAADQRGRPEHLIE